MINKDIKFIMFKNYIPDMCAMMWTDKEGFSFHQMGKYLASQAFHLLIHMDELAT